MKIAIYGDSFGYEHPIFGIDHPKLKEINPSWVTLLRNEYSVENFCYPASDLYFSYNNFISNYEKFDLNIFIATNPHRLSVKHNNQFIHNSGYPSAKAKLKTDTDPSRNKIHKASVDYFLYLQDDERDNVFSTLIKNSVKTLDKDCIIIDAFGKDGLFNITTMEDKSWKITPSYTLLDSFLDLRYCHLTEENNYILYNLIDKCIKNKSSFKFDLLNFVTPSFDERKKYLIKK